MKRLIAGFIVGGVLGVAAGFAGGIFVYPFWFLDDVATETVANADQQTKLVVGEFIHANPSDPVHYGKGTMAVYRDPTGARLVHLEQDFEVGPGPRFHVYLVTHAKVRTDDDFKNSEMVDLGRLKAFKGSQNYSIPNTVLLDKYKSVVVWCKEFNVLITPATLRAPAAKPAS